MAALLKHCSCDEGWLPCVQAASDVDAQPEVARYKFRWVVARWGFLDREGGPNEVQLSSLVLLLVCLVSKTCHHEEMAEGLGCRRFFQRSTRVESREDLEVMARRMFRLRHFEDLENSLCFAYGREMLVARIGATEAPQLTQLLSGEKADFPPALFNFLPDLLKNLDVNPSSLPNSMKYVFLSLLIGVEVENFEQERWLRRIPDALSSNQDSSYSAMLCVLAVFDDDYSRLLSDEKEKELKNILEKITVEVLLPKTFFGSGDDQLRRRNSSFNEPDDSMLMDDAESDLEVDAEEESAVLWNEGCWSREGEVLHTIWRLTKFIDSTRILSAFLSWLDRDDCLESETNVWAFLTTLGCFLQLKIHITQETLECLFDGFLMAFKYHRKNWLLVTELVAALHLIVSAITPDMDNLTTCFQMAKVLCDHVCIKSRRFLTNLCALTKVLLSVSTLLMFRCV